MKKWCVSLTMLAFSIMGTLAMADELKIEVMQEGDGDVAENGQRLTVHYEGRLTDDTVTSPTKPSVAMIAPAAMPASRLKGVK